MVRMFFQRHFGKEDADLAIETSILEHIDVAYGDVLYFTAIRWLSRGNVLRRFFELRTKIITFLGFKISNS